MIEKFRTQKPKEKSEENITRRELFRRGAKALTGAGAALALSNIEAIPLLAAELKEGTALKEGYETFLKNVFEKEEEVGSFLYRGKNNTGKWYGFTEGEQNKREVRIEGKTIIRSIEKILREKKVQLIIEAHTHPLSDFDEDAYDIPINLGEDELAEMKAGKRPLLSHPPSVQDLESNQKITMALRRQYGVPPSHFFSAVFDARGVWYHNMIPERCAAILLKQEAVTDMRMLLRQKVDAMSAHQIDTLFEEIKRRGTMTATPLSFDESENTSVLSASDEKYKRAVIFTHLYTNDNEAIELVLATEKEKETLAHGIKMEEELHASTERFEIAGNVFMIKSLRGALTAEDYTGLQEAYADQGSTLEFQSYQNMGLSYKDLHKR